MYVDRRLWSFTTGLHRRILGAAGLGLVGVALGIARLALLGWLLARVLAGAAVADLAIPIAGVAAVIAARALVEYRRTMLSHHTAVRAQTRLRERLYAHLVRLGPAYLTHERTGPVATSLVEGVQQLEVYFGQYLPQLVVAVATPLLIFAFVAFVDLPVAAVLVAGALFTLLAPALWHRHDRAASLARNRAYAAFGAELLDALQGLATLKAFGQSRERARLLEDKSHALFQSTMWLLGANTLGRGITDAGMAMSAAAALGVGAWRVSTGAMDLPALLVILMLGVEVFRPLRDLRVLLHAGMLGTAAARGIHEILAAQPLVLDNMGGLDGAAPGVSPTVTFDDVRFSYPGARRGAHDGVAFHVGAGERVAFVGPSGSGKSTVVRLLLRFYDPDAGRVLVGGRDVRTLPLAELRRHIAVVSQDTYLFHGTVEENLRMGRPEATAGELEAAARAANAHEFIARLPEGYQTIVGERGVRLSGGQRQRIAIARALLRDAPILVLDEALSSVDAESEALIQAALDRLMEGRTTLIFAHRLSSVIGADRIVVLDRGRVAESGTHAALMTQQGPYWRLMAPQLEVDPALARAGLSAVAAESANGRTPDSDDTEAAMPEAAVARAAALTWSQALPVLAGMIRGYRGRLGVTFVLGIARVAALMAVGVLGALVVRAVSDGADFGALLVALAVAAPLAGLLHWGESWLAHDMAYRLLSDMRLALYRAVDALAPAYLTRRRSGDLVAVATHDVELIEYFFAHTITPVLVAIIVPLAVLGTLVAFGWPLAAALAPFLVYAALSPVLRRARIDRLGSRAREISGDLTAHTVDSIQGIGEIVAFQRERARGEELSARAGAYRDARLPLLADLAREGALHEAVTALGGLAIVTVGAAMVATGGLEGATLPLLTLLALSAFVPLWEVSQVGRQLADTLGATRRVHAIHSEPVPVQDGPGVPVEATRTRMRAPARAAEPAIEIRHVTFTYPGRRRPALSGASLAVPAGSTVALVGSSGAGKTTIAHLCLRFWDPDAGDIRLAGHDLRAWRLDDLRREIALVAQDTYLFNDTLRANVLLARPGATDEQLRAALERASLGDLIDSMPAGLDTTVGERGMQLSGGQRQRVAIARAFLKDAPVLILDEATSHLDAVNEALVRRALEALARDRTTLVIAHRLSTVRDADLIAVLHEGRIAETGRHDDLLSAGGLYTRLVSRQVAAVTAPAI
ncbi:MAG TPA: ABC transporter ATP-binding protein [Candidatus Limnocylindria bacterium]|nr:ABC transporter ATP-binding protein [Candidatus Limnocylindria bacterium]